MVVTMALEDAGFEVHHEKEGTSALRVLAERSEDFNAVVTDVRLPQVDGWEIARRARELNAEVPVVYVTGDSAHEWKSKGVPNSLMVPKPFTHGELVAAIRAVLQVSQG